MVSFNAIVGDRSEENGFQKSWEIFKGEMVEGVGGGTCQVASTFHAAAFFGGLDVLERLPHSRPSAYIPMGLDSTVVYPIVDLKLRNPHPFPVVVHAKTDGNKLRDRSSSARARPSKVTLRPRGARHHRLHAQDRRGADARGHEGPREAARHPRLPRQADAPRHVRGRREQGRRTSTSTRRRPRSTRCRRASTSPKLPPLPERPTTMPTLRRRRPRRLRRSWPRPARGTVRPRT